MQIGDGALRMRGSQEDKALLTGQDLQPRREVACMIRPWVEFRRDPEIRAEEAAPEFGNQLLARAFAPFLAVTAEIAILTR